MLLPLIMPGNQHTENFLSGSILKNEKCRYLSTI